MGQTLINLNKEEKNVERKLVTIRRVKELQPIHNADRIKLAFIDGWKTVVKHDEFNVGDYGVYFEIDSLIPMEDERFEFIKTTKKMDGVKGRYVRTIRLCGQLSQGLMLPIEKVKEVADIVGDNPEAFLNQDFAKELNVIKYEENLDTGTSSEKVCDYPFYVEKTGENRIQNVFEEYAENFKDVEFVPTLKMDGSSMTVCYVNNPVYFTGRAGVDYKEDQTEQIWVGSHGMVVRKPTAKKSNAYYEAYNRTNLENTLPEWCRKNGKQIAIQGELVGPKVQGNFEKFRENTFKAFYVYFIDEGRRATVEEFDVICEELGLQKVVTYPPIKIFQEVNSVEDILDMAEGSSENHPLREGLVFKSNTLYNGRPISFKAIANSYLLKKK